MSSCAVDMMMVDVMMITHTCDTYTLRVHTATVHLRYTAGIMHTSTVYAHIAVSYSILLPPYRVAATHMHLAGAV